jgi:hypothetical protein
MDVYIHDTHFSHFSLTWRSLALVPLTATLLTGLIFCIRQRQARPRQAWFGGAAILLIMVHLSPVADLARAFLLSNVAVFPSIATPRRYADPYSMDPGDMIERFFIVSLMDSVLASIELGLLLWAMFGPDGGQRNRLLVENASTRGSAVE